MASDTRELLDDASLLTEDDGRYPEMEFITDVMKINDNLTLSDIPMGIPLEDWGQEGYHPMMAVGLGQNSSILNALKSTKSLVSKTWSMFYGWTGDDSRSQLDGTLVFGGYDRAKVDGRGYTIGMTETRGCASQLMVTIDDIIVNFRNGTNASLFPFDSDAKAACIEPDYPVLMTIPLDPYFDNLNRLTNVTVVQRSVGLAYYSMLYGHDDIPFDGELTFVIQSGPEIRIPNSQLVVAEKTVDESGEILANSSSHNLVLNAVQEINANDMPKLGRQFLSSAYIMVNQDAGEFTLWKANPSKSQDLVAVDEDGNEHTSFCEEEAANKTATPTSTPSPTTTDTSDSSSAASNGDTGLSTGATAGVAVGAVAGIAAVVIAAFLLWRRRRKAGALVPQQPLANADSSQHYGDRSTRSALGSKHGSYYKPELYGTVARPGDADKHHELVGNQPTSRDPYELP